jgi:hypothetical protein
MLRSGCSGSAPAECQQLPVPAANSTMPSRRSRMTAARNERKRLAILRAYGAPTQAGSGPTGTARSMVLPMRAPPAK